jgi:glycosyltransferase involved in cell wall biosynthesis
VVTVSEFSRQRIAELCRVPLERVVAIPNGVDSRFHPVGFSQQEEVRQRLGLPKKYVLCVGSLEPRKNLRMLLKAWSQASHLHPDLSLVLVGGTANYYRQAGLEQLPDRVVLAGRVDDADLPAIYSAAMMFVYPSLYEGFGLTVLEAMGCGTPVICSGTTSLPEVVGDAAVLIDPTNVHDLATAISDLAGNETRRAALKQLGTERCRLFSWDTAAERTWNVLQQAAGEM